MSGGRGGQFLSKKAGSACFFFRFLMGNGQNFLLLNPLADPCVTDPHQLFRKKRTIETLAHVLLSNLYGPLFVEIALSPVVVDFPYWSKFGLALRVF